MNDPLASLDGVQQAVWEMFAHAAASGGLVALATAREDGGAAARMVVLRGSDAINETLEIWTNRKSRKIDEIAKEARGEVLLWDGERQVQVRAAVTLSEQRGNAETWATLGNGSRLNYARAPAPGKSIDAPEAVSPAPDISLFSVLSAKVEALDVLSLADRPHRRAQIDADGARWVAP